MVKMNFTYRDGLKTDAHHEPSGARIQTAAPVDNNGDGSSFSPTDLLSTATVTCMMTLMGITADKHALSISGATASVEKHMAANPRRVAKLEITIDIPQRLTDDQQHLLKVAALNCPVTKSIHPDIELLTTFNFG